MFDPQSTLNMNQIVGSSHIVFITLDSLRYDVAQNALRTGQTPNLAKYLPAAGWEKRHTPGNFTFPAHQAFFAGFLPSPAAPGNYQRLFVSHFIGEDAVGDASFRFSEANIVTGLSKQGYYTLCVGGVGFFNKLTSLGCVFPDLFNESKWCESFSVSDPDSARHQIDYAVQRFNTLTQDHLVFLFVNI